MNFEELKKEKQRNFAERIWFIKYWVNYIKTHPAAEWSKEQAAFIDSQFKSAENFWRNLEKNDKVKFEKLKRLRLGV
ncbi:MAG: hypothetical protein KJ600_01665 [Nanoarchaeota archaeon]|nr:hypothetical protein [Nanoarchaeota archaeon]MBU1103246.1 hypothetical protein [Nanoarchaeota archaeon]